MPPSLFVATPPDSSVIVPPPLPSKGEDASSSEHTQQLRDSHLRSLLKAMSWRIIGTLDTVLISYLWTGHGKQALAIGGSEVITKIGLYYVHERIWARIPLGTVRRIIPRSSEDDADASQPLRDSSLRSLLKAFSWRILGTLDTIVVSYFWTGNTGKALVIGGTDMLTKLLLYYLHERAWAKIPLGSVRRLLRPDIGH
jgi:uncharacterized membrane protein